MKLDQLPKYLINLDSRTDRLEESKKQLKGIEYQRVSAIKGGAIGLSKTIKSLCDKQETFLMIEDDVHFTHPDAYENICKAFDRLPDDWDIFLGGSHFFNIQKQISNDLVKLGRWSSTHFAVINKRVFPYVYTHKNGHIDYHLSKQNLNVYMAYPVQVIQRAGYSDIQQKTTNHKIVNNSL